jgi:hypothetical protein
VAEGARLESVYTGNRIEGSNPSLSASSFGLWSLALISSTVSSSGAHWLVRTGTFHPSVA